MHVITAPLGLGAGDLTIPQSGLNNFIEIIVRLRPGFGDPVEFVKPVTENVSETFEGCPNLKVDCSCRISIGFHEKPIEFLQRFFSFDFGHPSNGFDDFRITFWGGRAVHLTTGIVLLECCVSAAVEELPQQHHRNVAFH